MAGRITPAVLSVRNQTRDTVLCSRAIVAHGWRGRTRGLLGRGQLSHDEGMLFEAPPFLPLMWMHTFFMAFPIDIVFVGPGEVVLKIHASLKPWRLSAIVVGAHQAIELSAGAAIRAKTAVGDVISMRKL